MEHGAHHQWPLGSLWCKVQQCHNFATRLLHAHWTGKAVMERRRDWAARGMDLVAVVCVRSYPFLLLKATSLFSLSLCQIKTLTTALSGLCG